MQTTRRLFGRSALAQLWRTYTRYLTAPLCWAVAVPVAIILTLSGPFLTYERPILERGVYWFTVMGVAVVLGYLFRVIAEARFGTRDPVRVGITVVILHSLCFTPALYFLTVVAYDAPVSMSFWEMLLIVAMVDIAINLVEYAVRLSRAKTGKQTAALANAGGAATTSRAVQPIATPVENTPRLLTRLPDGKRGSLIRLEVRNHHVDIITDRGSHSLLMRFSDAIAETAGAEGHQVHRSHWVAREAIATVSRDRGKVTLMMADGARIPVSRTRQSTLQSAGLL